MNYYIIGGDGKQYGPVTEADVRQWIAEGRLNGRSMAKAESDADFRPLSAFSEFASAVGAPPPISGMAPMSRLSETDEGRQEALRRVGAPAVALIVTAILNLITMVACWIVLTMFRSALLGLYAGQPEYDQIAKALQSANSPLSIGGDILGIVLSVLILVGATRMRSLSSYEFSMAAAIVAMLPCLTPCCLIGLPIGIWALVVLNRPDVKSQFH